MRELEPAQMLAGVVEEFWKAYEALTIEPTGERRDAAWIAFAWDEEHRRDSADQARERYFKPGAASLVEKAKQWGLGRDECTFDVQVLPAGTTGYTKLPILRIMLNPQDLGKSAAA